jgi:hypothetical protein
MGGILQAQGKLDKAHTACGIPRSLAGWANQPGNAGWQRDPAVVSGGGRICTQGKRGKAQFAEIWRPAAGWPIGPSNAGWRTDLAVARAGWAISADPNKLDKAHPPCGDRRSAVCWLNRPSNAGGARPSVALSRWAGSCRPKIAGQGHTARVENLAISRWLADRTSNAAGVARPGSAQRDGGICRPGCWIRRTQPEDLAISRRLAEWTLQRLAARPVRLSARSGIAGP